MYLNEVFRGRYQPAPPVTAFPNAASLNELMIVGPVTAAISHGMVLFIPGLPC
jgi:GTP cyclohydrolase I